jgi:hypothetical protein
MHYLNLTINADELAAADRLAEYLKEQETMEWRIRHHSCPDAKFRIFVVYFAMDMSMQIPVISQKANTIGCDAGWTRVKVMI